MTSENIEKRDPAKVISPAFNKWAYGVFVLLGVYYLFRHDYVSAAANLGIGLMFDPFNQTVKWQNRKPYQKVWLLVHVAIVFTLLIYSLAAGK